MYTFNKILGATATAAFKAISLAGRGAFAAGSAARRAIMRGAERRGMSALDYALQRTGEIGEGIARTGASVAKGLATSAGDYLDLAGAAARPFVKPANNFLGFEVKQGAGELLFFGAAAVGAIGGIRQASIGVVNYGDMMSYAGETMTPNLQQKQIRVNTVDNLGADGALTLALHQLRN